MTITSMISDLIALAVILLFCVLGWKKGMFRTFSGLLRILISLVGSLFLANYGAQLIAEYFVPVILPGVEEWLANVMAEQAAGNELDLGIFGWIPGVQQLVESVSDAVVDTIAPAIAVEVAGALAWIALFVIGFIVCILVCQLILLLLEMIDHLPGFHFLNHLIGGILGAVKGVLIVLLVVRVLLHFDVLPGELVAETTLLQWLAGSDSVH